MTDIQTIKNDLTAFGAAFSYDTSYVVEFVDHSPAAFEAFSAATAIANFQGALPNDARWVAKIASALTEDCGSCAQLGLRHAVLSGVDRGLLQTLLDDPASLPGALADVAAHARAAGLREPDDDERAARLRATYGDEGFADLALAIVGGRLYPMLKRALSRTATCTKPTLDF